MDTCDKHTDIQNMHDEHTNHQNVHDECMNGSNPCTTHSKDQSDKHTSNMNMYDSKTTNKQYETHKTIKLHGQKQSWQKFKQNVTNCQDHKQDWSSLSISTLLVFKPEVQHPTLQSCIPEK